VARRNGERESKHHRYHDRAWVAEKKSQIQNPRGDLCTLKRGGDARRLSIGRKRARSNGLTAWRGFGRRKSKKGGKVKKLLRAKPQPSVSYRMVGGGRKKELVEQGVKGGGGTRKKIMSQNTVGPFRLGGDKKNGSCVTGARSRKAQI